MNTGSRIPMHFAPPPHMFATNSSATAVPASLPTSRMSTRDRAQSWRGKYLRALNICPEPQDDKAVDIRQQTNSKLRTRSYHRVSDGDRNSLSKSYSSSTEKEDEERKSNSHHQASPSPSDRRIHAVPLRVPTTSSSNTPYGFVMKPGLARGRRCHTDPFLFEERVSAPIQIPTPGSVTSQLDGGHERPSHKSPMTHRLSTNTTNNTPAPLLSWEEPVAMLKAADAVARGWKMTHEDNMNMELGVQRDRGDNQLQEEDEDDHFMDDDDDDHDDIFEMDDDSSAAPSTAVPVSRRRQRTASLNIVSSGREKRVHHGMHDLSKSFVPPHQMVERDCFSIGLRDELRRRPTNHI